MKSTFIKRLLLPQFLIAFLSAAPSSSCPKSCTCSAQKVECSSPGVFQSFEQLVASLPNDTQILHVEKQTIASLSLRSTGLEGFPQLTDLKITECGVETIQDNLLSAAPQLINIDLSNNLLQTINENIFRGMRNVIRLSLEKNQLSDIPHGSFQDCHNLQILTLSWNKLTSIGVVNGSFKGLSSLKEVLLSYNLLGPRVEIDLRDSKSFNSIRLGNNLLEEFTEATITPSQTLKEIWMEKNRLTNISPNALKQFSVLGALVVSQNQIRTLHPNVFRGLNRMTALHLNVNPLVNLTSFIPELPSLELLDLSETNMISLESTLFSRLVNLRNLQLRSNHIQNIPARVFTFMGNLQILGLESNVISSIDAHAFHGLGNLKRLRLLENKLWNLTASSVYFKPLVSLTHLRFSSDTISEIPDGWLHDLPTLEYLWMDRSYLKTIGRKAFPATSNLIGLYLHFNYLTSFSLDSEFPYLKEVGISSNRLLSIDSNTFRLMPSLETVQLQNNKLTAIPVETFEGNQRLKHVNLNKNKIRFLDLRAFSGLSMLEFLDLSRNPLCVNKYEVNALESISGAVFDTPDICVQTTTTTTRSTTESFNTEILIKESSNTETSSTIASKPKDEDNRNLIWIIVWSVFGFLFLLCLVTTIFLCYRRKRKPAAYTEPTPQTSMPKVRSYDELGRSSIYSQRTAYLGTPQTSVPEEQPYDEIGTFSMDSGWTGYLEVPRSPISYSYVEPKTLEAAGFKYADGPENT